MFIHDIRPTCTEIFLKYLYYNITLNTPVSIRKGPSSENQTQAVERQNKLASFIDSWHNVKEVNSKNVDISL
jgi:hypothetical protein